jgi:putative membrane protein
VLKKTAYIAGVLGSILFVALFVREDFGAILHTLVLGGWNLLWLVPYRAVFFLLFALCWLILLRPADRTHRAGLAYLFWATTVRDAVDRLLPVASVGGSVVGFRLVRWLGIAGVPIAASVLIEIILTLIVVYLFVALGFVLSIDGSGSEPAFRRLLLAFALSLPVPVVTLLLLRYGSVAQRLHRLLRPLLGDSIPVREAASFDDEVRSALRRYPRCLLAAALQFLAMLSGAFEIWFALRLFGHPVGVEAAIILESMTQAVRHLAFIVPGALGVQEAGLIIFGHSLGIDADLALAISMTKRLRELLCGLPSLLSWQWFEGRRLQGALRHPS